MSAALIHGCNVKAWTFFSSHGRQGLYWSVYALFKVEGPSLNVLQEVATSQAKSRIHYKTTSLLQIGSLRRSRIDACKNNIGGEFERRQACEYG